MLFRWENVQLKIISKQIAPGRIKRFGPLFHHLKRQKWGKIILQEGEMTITDNHQIANIFNDYFSNIASNIGFNDAITSARDAIIDHQNHPSILKIREKYAIKDDAFDFDPVSEELIDSKLRSINIGVSLKDIIIFLENCLAWPMPLWRHIWPIWSICVSAQQLLQII